MRQRELRRVRHLYAKRTRQLCRSGQIPGLPPGISALIADFAKEQAYPKCVERLLPKLGSRLYEVVSDAGEIHIKIWPKEAPNAGGRDAPLQALRWALPAGHRPRRPPRPALRRQACLR